MCEEILPIAGGRIWAGYKALELGLVDKIGDLDDALLSAAEKAGLKDFKVKTYKKPVDPIDALLNGLLENINIKVDVDPRLELLSSVLPKQLKVINEISEGVSIGCRSDVIGELDKPSYCENS